MPRACGVDSRRADLGRASTGLGGEVVTSFAADAPTPDVATRATRLARSPHAVLAVSAILVLVCEGLRGAATLDTSAVWPLLQALIASCGLLVAWLGRDRLRLTPILVLGAISAGFAVFSIGAGSLAGPKRYNRAKLDAYECGIEPTPHAAGGGRFPVKYYLVAMLFIVFDVESLFLYPFAVAFNQLGLFALVEMVLFIVTVFVAYSYVWQRGGLEWD